VSAAGSAPGPAQQPADAAAILEQLPDGIALVSRDDGICWANGRLAGWCGRSDVCGLDFFEALGRPEVLGPDATPFRTAIESGRMTTATLRTADNRYFHLQASGSPSSPFAVAAVRDVTHAILDQQKLAAIHQAGQKLADLAPTEVADMTVEERIDLLKSNILYYSKDLLQFDVVEIRLLDRQTGRLEPLLAVGMQPEAEARVLYARPENNGVTGYVAAGPQLHVRRHHEGSSLPRGLQGREGLDHGAAASARSGDRHVQRREPGARRFLGDRPAVSRDLLA
jgi:hypothetical protein